MSEQMMNQVLKFNIKQFKDNTLTIEPKKLQKHSTLIKESELLRIIKHLNPENQESMFKNGRYPFIKDIIIINVKNETKLYRDTKGYLIFNHEKYKRLLASSSNIRNTKVVFIKETLYDKANKILLCGLPEDIPYNKLAKFSSYYALCTTDSIPISFRPRIVIVDDFAHEIKEIFDVVEEKVKGQYEVKDNEERSASITPFDGAGLVSIECAKKFCKELDISLSEENSSNISPIPSYWQFRFIPCGKGNLFTFDIKQFAEEKKVTKVIDLWGEEWELFDNEGNLLVDIILTKSQFKFHNLYESYESWYKAFTTKEHGYARTFNISSYSDTKRLSDQVALSYQPLQTLTIDNEEIKKLSYKTVKTYNEIRNDVDEFLNFRGIRDVDINEEREETDEQASYLPPYYQALRHCKDLFNDEYIQGKIKDDLNGYKNRSCKGMLLLNGSYQVFVPDLVALAQYAFGLKVEGVLKKDEIYNQFWHSKRVERVALCRFPHVAREWKLSKVVMPESDDTKYLDHITQGYVTNIWDSTALRMGTADFDGDHIYGLAEGTLLNIIKRQESNTILHVPPELTEKQKEREKQRSTFPINNMEELIETDCRGMKGGIGHCINHITILWSLDKSDERDKYIKIMSVIGAQIIDYAKTGIKAKIPKDIRLFLNKKQLPYFMCYKYPQYRIKEERIGRLRAIRGLEEKSEHKQFENYNCTVNKISWYLEKEFARIDKDIKDKTKLDFNWRKLLKGQEDKLNKYSETYKNLKSMIKQFNEDYCKLAQLNVYETNPADIKDNNYKFSIFYDYARNSILDLCRANVDIDKILDYLLAICYTDKKYTNKAILWNCFADEMINRVKGIDNKEELAGEEIKSKLNKTKEKMKKIKDSNDLVKVVLAIDDKEIDLTKIEDGVNIYQSDIDHIRGLELDVNRCLNHKKLLLVLLVFYRLHQQNGVEFYICPGRKNKVTPSHICKLASVSMRKFDEIMKELFRKECIKSTDDQVNQSLLVDLSKWTKNSDGIKVIKTIKDINEIKKVFKMI